MEIGDKLKNFINENLALINENTKESWEKVYASCSYDSKLVGKFTNLVLDARINDPAIILGYLPKYYLAYTAIEQYDIPNNVAYIAVGAFEGCNKLENVTIPEGVEYIDYRAFSKCGSLTNIVIPRSVTKIGTCAFELCENLTQVVFQDGVTEIGGWAFYFCAKLVDVVLPASIQSIDRQAFQMCTNLKTIKFQGTKKQWRAVKKGVMWKSDTQIGIVQCVDGVVEYKL